MQILPRLVLLQELPSLLWVRWVLQLWVRLLLQVLEELPRLLLETVWAMLLQDLHPPQQAKEEETGQHRGL